MAKWIIHWAGIALATLTASACNPRNIERAVTLRPPAVQYVTPTLTPTVTPSSTVTPTASNTYTPSPTTTHTPTSTFTSTFTPTATFTPTPFPTRVPGATYTPVSIYGSLSMIPQEHFWMHRPIPSENQDFIEPTYRYGSTQGGTLRPHHGVYFDNDRGTPVLSTNAGMVVFAGTDSTTKLGPEPGFYGRAVVVQLQQAFLHQPVYVLYGHLDNITVSVGQNLIRGEPLGTVGGSGIARGGNHLHLEVRVGHNDYRATRNPELWLQPYPGWGTLAGRVTDSHGNLVPMADITIQAKELSEAANKPFRRYLTTYVTETINPDEILGENFAASDLPAGRYRISVNTGNKIRSQEIDILPSRLAWLEFRDVPPLTTANPTMIGTSVP